jgi:hypothetical protein
MVISQMTDPVSRDDIDEEVHRLQSKKGCAAESDFPRR